MSENRTAAIATAAIAGLGVAAKTIHLPAIAKLPELKIVGACDPAAKPGGFPFPLYSSAKEMLDKTRPDLLVVATPPSSHFDLTRLGLESGFTFFAKSHSLKHSPKPMP